MSRFFAASTLIGSGEPPLNMVVTSYVDVARIRRRFDDDTVATHASHESEASLFIVVYMEEHATSVSEAVNLAVSLSPLLD